MRAGMRRFFGVFLVMSSVLAPALPGQDRAGTPLSGLPGVYVSVHISGRDVPEGLSDEQLAGEIEHDLKASGVPVLSEAQMLRAPGAPILQVSIVLVKAMTGRNVPLGFGYAIQVEVVENVSLERAVNE